MALLILLWGLVICFMGYQYTRERDYKEGLISSSLQLVNVQMGDDLENGVTPREFFDRNSKHINKLRITLFDKDGNVKFTSDKKQCSITMTQFEEKAIALGSSNIVKQIYNDQEYIYAITHYDDLTICSSLPYSITFSEVFRDSNAFLIVIIAISILISIIGYITSSLYRSLETATLELDKEHESALREEQDKIRLKRQLTNNINHELKTPVCSILGYTEMIINNPDISPENCRAFVAKAYDQAERLRHLMTDLSTITRIDEASDMIDMESVDLNKMIHDMIDDVMPQSEKQNITIKSNMTTPTIINGNYSLLYSIFRNLIDNAIAYSGGRYVWVNLQKESNDTLYFSVRDNGIGIEEKHLAYIFERFYRVDKGRSRKLGGTGLGLSIVKNAVLFHGGTIEAHTEEFGGLEFKFTLKR